MHWLRYRAYQERIQVQMRPSIAPHGMHYEPELNNIQNFQAAVAVMKMTGRPCQLTLIKLYSKRGWIDCGEWFVYGLNKIEFCEFHLMT
jgi:hypothetical protein